MKQKRKRCKECKELFTPIYSTVQMVCSPKCAYAYSKRRDTDIKEQNSVLLEKMAKERKERIGLTTLLESVKTVCHTYIKLRDNGKPCISCGTQWHKDFQAGHFYKAELFSSLKFDENNIHGQCVKCNIRLEGNLNDYELNLPKRILKPLYDELKDKAQKDKQNNFKWCREDLKAIRTYYRNKIKEIKKAKLS